MRKVEVVLEALDNDGYRASVGHPFELSAEAATREETLAALKGLLDHKLAHVEVLEMDVGPPSDHPWKTIVGTWKDHPDLDEVLENTPVSPIESLTNSSTAIQPVIQVAGPQVVLRPRLILG